MSSGERTAGFPGVVPVVGGAIASAGSYVLGYLLTVGVLLLDATLDGGGGSVSGGGTGDQAIETFGTIFYSAHLLEMDLEVDSPFYTGPDTTDLLKTIDFVLPNVAYYAVPVVVLFLAGAFVAWLVEDAVGSPVAAGVAGASIVVLYLPLVYLGTRMFGFQGSQLGAQYTVSPPVTRTVLQAGLLYPVVLGLLGGLAFYGVRRRRNAG